METSWPLRTARLVVAPATAEDLDAVMALENDPANADFVWQGTREEHLAEIEDPAVEILVVRRAGEDEVVGYALSAVNRRSNVYELRRLAVGPKDQGYGREVIEGLFRHAFEDLGTHRFWLDVYPHNARGIHLYESLGMHRDGVLRGSYLAHDGYRDQVVYSLLVPEWRSRDAVPDVEGA